MLAQRQQLQQRVAHRRQRGDVAATPRAHRMRAAGLHARLARKQQQQVLASAVRPNASFDSSDDLDTDLAHELQAVVDPGAAERMRSHFDLLWKVTRGRPSSQVQTCTCCSGVGEKECEWCHGTGFLTVGDQVFTGGINKNQCPVCKATGYVKCDFCRGTGSRAQWLPALFDARLRPQQQEGSGGGGGGGSVSPSS